MTAVDERPGTERPAPPFTTSTLTQEASRKLGFSTERTMQIAQRLFQGVEIGNGEIEGLITYHRTDSTTLSDKAISESARVIADMFGAEYYAGARRYQTKVKNAQEAHEAIRPTDFRLAPQQLAGVLDSDELRLVRADLEAHDGVADGRRARAEDDGRVLGATRGGETAVFTATGKTIDFAGFRRAYVEGSDDPIAELEDQETVLPPLPRRAIACSAPGAAADAALAHAGAGAQEARDAAAGALHRSVAHQGTRAGGHRPAVHVRVDHRARSSAAATCSARARRWCRASRRSP